MKTLAQPIACADGSADSDSVNLGSNPSPPATENIDVEEILSRGQLRHLGTDSETRRTEAGTLEFGKIYFLTDGSAIKIGFSGAPALRMANLQTSTPIQLRLIGTVAATQNEESELHRLFAHCRIRGEWFLLHQAAYDAKRRHV